MTIVTHPSAVFTLPEILEYILSFLTRNERKNAARYVCKQWFYICRSLAPPRPLVWYPNWKDQDGAKTLQALGGAGILRLMSWADGPGDRVFGTHIMDPDTKSRGWERLLSGIELQLQQSQGLLPLQEIELRHDFTEPVYFNQILPLLPQFSFLSTLRMYTTDGPPDRVLLHSVLSTCSNLKVLIVAGPETPKRDCLHDASKEYFCSRERLSSITPLPMLRRLKTLTINNALLSRGTVESIIEASPNLRSLTILQAFTIPQSWQDTIDVGTTGAIDLRPVFDRMRFFQLMEAVWLNLQRFHLSVRNDLLSTQEFMVFMDSRVSRLPVWSFSDQELQPGYPLHKLFFSTDPLILRNHHQRLTSLELVRTPKGRMQSEGALHHFLCEATHLQNLRAINVPIDIESLDVNRLLVKRRFKDGSKSDEQILYEQQESEQQLWGQGRPRVWACRGLLTLHVTLETRDFLYPEPVSKLPVSSQIVFGYISKCCPNLKEIHLRRQHSEMSRGSGFCLLSRLRYLERLMLMGETFLNLKIKELAWLGSQRYRYPSSVNDGDMLSSGRQESDVDLCKLGLPSDINAWTKESRQRLWGMFSRKGNSNEGKEGVCWPRFESLKITYVRGQMGSAESIDAMQIQGLMHINWPGVMVDFEIARSYD
ncbi:hypothetical protein BGZ80_005639 [Entomortierella chlamydospora]|uniref:F-box domain-containing protein n=1 Tax=Entomortierella chlamydospora TaxID=101097 RepID=A0A9P6N0J8_9FUNG|nr:hypothetical protein BGZ80_005639 [Entomortierella chlamydospora]